MTIHKVRSSGFGLFAVAMLVIWNCGGKDGAGTTGAAGTTGVAGTVGTAGTSGDAGVSGSAGRGGVTGVAGVTGVGGSPTVCIPQAPANCGIDLCGNGKIDTCDVPSGIGPCPTISFTEVCDGTHFGTDTCAAHGYGSGNLSCGTACTVETSSCVDCATGSKIASCGNAPLDTRPDAVAIAGNGNEIGIASLGHTVSAQPTLTFARLSATLQLVSTTAIQDDAFASGGTSVVDVRLAPLPSGWVMAAWVNQELFIHTLDATGKDLGRTTVEMVPSNAESISESALFAARGDGGPLMVWLNGRGTLHAAVVAADGRSVTTPRVLPLEADITNTSAVYMGGAFYVAAVVGNGLSGSLRMVRIETDGTVGAASTVVDVLPGVTTNDATLASGADDLRLVYVGQAVDGGPAGIVLQKIAATGASASSPVTLPAAAEYDHACGAVAFGADTVVLLCDGGEGALGAVRVGANGQIVTPPFRIMGLPTGLAGHITEQKLARVGSDIVSAWYTDSQIRLARVTP